MAFHEIICVNSEEHCAVFIVANRYAHFIEFRFLQTLDEFLADYILSQHDFEYIIILVFYLLWQALIVFVKLFRICCLSYSFIHAAKVIYLFQLSKFLGRKMHFLTKLRGEITRPINYNNVEKSTDYVPISKIITIFAPRQASDLFNGSGDSDPLSVRPCWRCRWRQYALPTSMGSWRSGLVRPRF